MTRTIKILSEPKAYVSGTASQKIEAALTIPRKVKSVASKLRIPMSRKSTYNVEIHIEAKAAIISITASIAFRLKTFITNFVGIYVTRGNNGCVFVRQWLADRLVISSMTRLVSLSNHTSPS